MNTRSRPKSPRPIKSRRWSPVSLLFHLLQPPRVKNCGRRCEKRHLNPHFFLHKLDRFHLHLQHEVAIGVGENLEQMVALILIEGTPSGDYRHPSIRKECSTKLEGYVPITTN